MRAQLRENYNLIYTVSGKDQQYIIHNFDKFKCVVVNFHRRHRHCQTINITIIRFTKYDAATLGPTLQNDTLPVTHTLTHFTVSYELAYSCRLLCTALSLNNPPQINILQNCSAKTCI